MVDSEPPSSEPRAPVPRPPLPGRRRQLLDDLRFRLTDPRVGAVALGVVALAAGAFWYVTSMRAEGERSSPAPVASDSTVAADAPTSEAATEDGVVTVHVAGAVAEPGVIELGAGSRVIDAVEAVGGARPDGDLDRLNLAATVADGQRVMVPVIGQPLPPGDPAGATGDPTLVEGGLLDLNTATQEQLEELPGIGPALAGAILDEREKRGGFQSVDDLKGVRGIGEKRFADIEDLVTVP